MGGDGMGVPSGVDVRPRHQVRQVRAEPRSWEVPQNGQAEPGRDTELRKPIFRNMMQNELCPD